MPTLRPDQYLIALLELHGIIPAAVAEAACRWYDTPQPVNYETAREFVHERIHELIDSGALDDVMGVGIDDSDGPPVGSSPRRVIASQTSISPPDWWVAAYADWAMLDVELELPEPEEC